MNLKALTFGAAILATVVIPFISTAPASAQTSDVDPGQPLTVGGQEYVVITSLPITINRNNAESPMQQTKVSTDGRYQFVGFLNAITQERQEADPPAARQLYRLATVQDRQTGKTVKAALPIRFEP
jgi:hypothetical protein